MAEKSDVELVREFKAGSASAFDAFVGRFQDRVYRLACVWLYDPQNADDATQEVFLRAHKGLRRFQFRAAPFTWLYRTTRSRRLPIATVLAAPRSTSLSRLNPSGVHSNTHDTPTAGINPMTRTIMTPRMAASLKPKNGKTVPTI